VDEFTREALACDVERSIDADGVVRCLDRLAADRGAPVYVRFDNGPEFIAHAVADWCRFNGTGTVFTGLYAMRRGERPLIRAVGRVSHLTPEWSNNRSR